MASSTQKSQSDNLTTGWSDFFSQISMFLMSCGRQYGLANEDYSEYVIERLSVTLRGVNDIGRLLREADNPILSGIETSIRELALNLEQCIQLWREYMDGLGTVSGNEYTPSLEYSGRGAGRPRFTISKEQLLYLRSLSFTWTSISKMLMVSRMTIYRRRVEYDLNEDNSLSISDEVLATAVRGIIEQHPAVGQSFVWGVLRSQGCVVSRERVRQAVRRCDPLNTALRLVGISTPRQPYSVPGPNSLWHIGEACIM